jgi:hypothetical protein
MNMLTANDFDSMAEWLIANYSYGHLDEIPDRLLMIVMKEPSMSLHFACLFIQASRTVSDDVEELVKEHSLSFDQVMTAAVRVRAWILLERMRRLGKVKFHSDVLIKEMAALNFYGHVSTFEGAKAFALIEVSPGVVNIVGEKIDLCKE